MSLAVPANQSARQSSPSQTRLALMTANLDGRTNLSRRLRGEIMKIGLLCGALIALGVYAADFVVHGLMAKPDLNGLIFVTFLVALGIAINNILTLKHDKLAIDSLKTDFAVNNRPTIDVTRTPAKVFKRPKLLGFGYRLVTEQLLSGTQRHLTTETVSLLVKDVDQRISDAKAAMGYFGGLLVFLGLLGAFIGLMKTVGSVGDLIGSMNISSGDSSQFGRLIEDMKKPLNGMATGFSSSLFGLLFSMSIGLVDRFMASAMKAVRNEFEACLMNLAQLEAVADEKRPVRSAAEGSAVEASTLAPGLGLSEPQFNKLLASLHRSEHHNARTNEHLAALTATVHALATTLHESRRREERAPATDDMRTLATAQAKLADSISSLQQAFIEGQERVAEAVERSGALQAQAVDIVGAVSFADESAHVSAQDRSSETATGARALLDRLSMALFHRPHTDGSGDRHRQLEQAVLATQQLSRQVLHRLDVARKDESRVVLAAGKAQRQLLDSLEQLTDRIDQLLKGGELMPRERLDAMAQALHEATAHMEVGLGRLEAQVQAGREEAAHAQRAARAQGGGRPSPAGGA